MKIYKITEASEYLGVSINTLKTLANKVYGPPPPTLQDSWKDMEKRMREAAEKWQERNKPEPIVYGPPPATIPKTTFDRDAVICRDGRDAHGPAPSEMQQLRNLEQEISKLPWTEEEKT